MYIIIMTCLAGLLCVLLCIKLVEDGYNITKGPQLGISCSAPRNLLLFTISKTMFSYCEEDQVNFAIAQKEEHQATLSNENRQ